MNKKQKIVIISAISILILFTLAGKLYKNQQYENDTNNIRDNSSSLIRDYSVKKGSDDAKVKLVEFFDPACPACANFYPRVEKIIEKHKDNIQLILRYAPFHHGSKYVVKMLEASRKQGKFFKTLKLIFESQGIWASGYQPQPEKLWALLPQAGLDIDKLAKDMDDPEIEDRINQDLADIKKLKITQTPEYFVNGKPLKKFGFRQLENLINSELYK